MIKVNIKNMIFHFMNILMTDLVDYLNKDYFNNILKVLDSNNYTVLSKYLGIIYI